MALSLGSWNEHTVFEPCHDSEMRLKECKVSSLDISLCFLEPCIRMQTSTSWMIHSVQWTQESAGTCLNCEFGPVLSSLLSRNPVEIREESSGKPLCWRLSSLCPGVPPFPPFPPQKICRREILPYDEVRTGTYSRCFQCVGASGVRALGSEG